MIAWRSRRALYVVLLLPCLGLLWLWHETGYSVRGPYYLFHDILAHRLSRVDAIKDARVHSSDDLFYDDHRFEFRLADRPDTFVSLAVGLPLEDPTGDPGHLALCQLGDRRFRTRYLRPPGPAFAEQGELALGWCPDISPDGEFAHLVPFSVRNVHDIASHYDLIADAIDTWPQHPEVGEFETDSGVEVRYFVTRDSDEGWASLGER